MVTLSSPQWVKSNWASRPGGCTWGKYTSRSGPCSARQSCNRRCSVRSWDALNRPGYCLAQPVDNCRRLQLASWIIPQQRLDLILPHPVEGIGTGAPPMPPVSSADGKGPLCQLRAERTLIPALAAAVSCVLPSIRFCLISLTCRSVINRRLRTN